MLRATTIINGRLRQSVFSKATSYGLRAMSGLKLHRFVVFAPDYTDEGALERRLKVRAQHLEGAHGSYKDGTLQTGGALLAPDGLEASNPASKLIGSMLIILAPNLEEARKRVESDIYWLSDVWDRERVVVLPFLQLEARHD